MKTLRDDGGIALRQKAPGRPLHNRSTGGLRKWIVKTRLWLSRNQRRVFLWPLLRRGRSGGLIQTDGFDHRWFGNHHIPSTLIVAVDDMTVAIREMRFVPSESTLASFELLSGYQIRAGFTPHLINAIAQTRANGR